MQKINIKGNQNSNISRFVVMLFDNEEITYEFNSSNNEAVLNLTSDKIVVKCNNTENYILTDLVYDEKIYNSAQKRFLFELGKYSIFINVLKDLIFNKNNFSGIVVDINNCLVDKSFKFNFESITDTYKWLKEKQKITKEKQKIINFYDEKIYNDSYNEINYLTEKITSIKKGKEIEDLFILNDDELKILLENYFFKLLLNSRSSNYKMYIVNKDELMKSDLELYNYLRDGIIIYEDCIYRDDYSSEYSLGYVMCDDDNIKKYNVSFELLIEKYAREIGEVDGI